MVFLTMEDVEDSAAGPPQHRYFVELSAECRQQLATLRKRKQQSQCTKEAKKAKREQEKLQKKKHVESLQKPSVNYAHFHVQFNHSFELTCTARHEASCTCLLLVYNKISE